jgi:hypothetical protein
MQRRCGRGKDRDGAVGRHAGVTKLVGRLPPCATRGCRHLMAPVVQTSHRIVVSSQRHRRIDVFAMPAASARGSGPSRTASRYCMLIDVWLSSRWVGEFCHGAAEETKRIEAKRLARSTQAQWAPMSFSGTACAVHLQKPPDLSPSLNPHDTPAHALFLPPPNNYLPH